jgi:ferrous iron transport protein A
VAPLGDPISIAVAGYHLSLRLNEARSIFVQTAEHN